MVSQMSHSVSHVGRERGGFISNFVSLHQQVTHPMSNIAQWKSDGLITRRSLDRDQVLLLTNIFFFSLPFESRLLSFCCTESIWLSGWDDSSLGQTDLR